MRTAWTIVSVLAVAHLFALAAFAGWLLADGRLNGDRLERIREMFGERVVDEQARLEAEASELAAAEASAAAAARLKGVPIPASALIEEDLAATAYVAQVGLRQTRAIEDLRRSLWRERDDLDKEWERLHGEQALFQEYLARLVETTGTEQFKKAISTLEGQKPKDAAAWLESLLAEGDMDEVVSYLNEMEERARNKIFAEFDPALAADLLERLRTRGVTTPDSPETATQ
jgi:flagellar motility protein MotE (MotC chaperone)